MKTEMEHKSDILVVDDNPDNLRVLAEILQDAGYLVRTIRDSCRVLDAIQAQKPELILLDIMMPDRDGFMVCRDIKAIDALSAIPIIFISALKDISDKVNAFQKGGVDYITKPFHREEVLARVENHLKLYHLQNRFQEQAAKEVERRRRQEQLLIQQSKLASMGEMLGAIAHQWKQPLNILSMTIQDFQDSLNFKDFDEAYIQKAMQDAEYQIEYMTQTINDFRQFLKPSKQKSVFDVRNSACMVIQRFSAQYKYNKIDIHIDCGENETAYSAVGYPNEFKHALLIFFNNSRDAILRNRDRTGDTTPGTIRLTFTQEENRIFTFIDDNGGGIDPDIMSTLFQPYATTKGDSGDGIGLYMAKTIIEENMDGKIYSENTDEGARFIIELPVAPEELN